MKPSHLNKFVFTACLVVGFFCVSYFMTGCNDCKTDPILIYASKDLKGVGAFKPGTFWVYQNDFTHVRDCVIVTSFEDVADTIFEACQNNGTAVANFTQTLYTHTTSLLFNENYVWKVQVGEPVLLAKENFDPDTIYVDAQCTDTSFCSIVDTLQIGSIKYLNVYERIDSSSSLEDGQLTHFFSLPKFGIIRREVLNPDNSFESWSLVHAYIIQ
jgi:hypothetical protein